MDFLDRFKIFAAVPTVDSGALGPISLCILSYLIMHTDMENDDFFSLSSDDEQPTPKIVSRVQKHIQPIPITSSNPPAAIASATHHVPPGAPSAVTPGALSASGTPSGKLYDVLHSEVCSCGCSPHPNATLTLMPP